MTTQEPVKRPEAETEDAHPMLVGVIASSLGLIVGLGLFGGLLFVGRPEIRAERLVRGSDETFEHGVVAASDIERSWAEINRSTASEAENYAWIDRRAGIVRVPISRAIDLICEEQGRPNTSQPERRESP
jgi:hypothetical protein